jgi:hypothetical protein
VERSSSNRDLCVRQDIVFRPNVVASVKDSTQAVHIESILLSSVYYALNSTAVSPSDDDLLSLRKYRYSARLFFRISSSFDRTYSLQALFKMYLQYTRVSYKNYMGVKLGRSQ